MTERNIYNGSVCRDALSSCLPNNESDTYISSGVDQKKEEDNARLLIEALEEIGASEECKKAATLFFCLYAFGLCINNDTSPYKPPISEFMYVSTNVCSREWKIGSKLVTLPVCTDLSDNEILTCKGECHLKIPGSVSLLQIHLKKKLYICQYYYTSYGAVGG